MLNTQIDTNVNQAKQELLINAYKDYATTIGQPEQEINPLTRTFFKATKCNPKTLELGGILYLTSLFIIETRSEDLNIWLYKTASLNHFFAATTWQAATFQVEPETIRFTIIQAKFH